LKAISGKELCKLLEGKDWILKRVNGSHHIYAKSGINARISVPVHKNQSLKLGLQRHIMKIANISESEL
jgi:predicted RNA binding protein YcfA (HicA-like mRNA interferase family)